MTRFYFENRLGVPTPAEIVWKVISDLPGWAAWNPLYVKAEGALGFGAKLTLTQSLNGETTIITPTVVDWVPDSHVHWRISEMGGLVQRVRYLEIEKLSDEGCVFSHGEIWSGRLAGFVRGRMRGLNRAFEAMGEAVRERSIAIWREEGGGPTS
jgi:hypothetical protein